ncbi:Signal transduction histidine kinase [Nocardioides sp. YR527]|uniref:HAMP domain-containing sensor histidine kinase n=1 Tax=Nocardioides sp. YR527 TaxID=1881028 RepID=UPI00088F8359|nr:HAMP domain-containing sensor histidine kinase [Nocardioides sp. YR527]SDK53810.1 Signal transduction histidine kinase [Nocardioides sp. YR527]
MKRHTWRIGTRLLLAQALVLVAAILTAAVIAALVGPPTFNAHMRRADRAPDPSERMHVEEAYRTASAISLGLAVAAALLIALLVTWYLTRRFQTPLTDMTRAATAMAGGRYDARVPVGDAGPEMDSLAVAFNSMAGELARTEDTRRRLLSDLAHELRTPVATLAAYLEGLEDGVTPWNEETRALLADQVHRLDRLAGDIDAVSRAEEGRLSLHLAPVAVADLVRTAVRAQQGAYAAKGVALGVAGGPPVVIDADESRLLQVLTNLLDNARRHTPEHGSVSIAWEMDREHADRRVAIRVTDTGDGIPAVQLPHIFERFYRGDSARDREHQGSGIGLTISRAIATAHGGSLDATSGGPGAGSSLVLTLPASRSR